MTPDDIAMRDRLMAEIGRLRAALEFYSKRENYMEVRGPAGLHSYQIKGAEVVGDCGKIAREALTAAQ